MIDVPRAVPIIKKWALPTVEFAITFRRQVTVAPVRQGLLDDQRRELP